MKFSLLLSEYNSSIFILKETDPLDFDESLVQLSKRDPEQPVELRTDCFYFNPLLKKNEANYLYSVSGNDFIISHTGKPLKGLKKDQGRGWFMLPPVALRKSDIHLEVMKLITRSPRLTGVIAQLARATMGLKVPPELNCPSKDDWLAWICAQKHSLTPQMVNAFNLLRAGTALLKMSDQIRSYLETGQEPEPVHQIRVRWCELREFNSIKRRLYESGEWEMEISPKTLAAGKEALIKEADAKFGAGWAQIEEYVTGEDVIENEQEKSRAKVPLFFIKNGSAWELINFPGTPDSLPMSINDLFNEAIKLAKGRIN